MQFAVKATVDLGDLDIDFAAQGAAGRDAQALAVHAGFDLAFDDQRLAVENLGALELDVGADDQVRAPGRDFEGGKWVRLEFSGLGPGVQRV